MSDLDLWVRDRRARESLCAALLDRGAVLLRDFHPYCLKFRLEGQLIEITYHNVKDGTLTDVLNTFDLAVCGIGARFERNRVTDVTMTDECWHSLRRRELTVHESCFCALLAQKSPGILRTLHRMGQAASELGYRVDAVGEHRLWDLYWHDYSEDERSVAMDLYFDTMVAYKGQHDEHLVRRATVGYATVQPHPADVRPARLASKAA